MHVYNGSAIGDEVEHGEEYGKDFFHESQK